MTGLTAQQALMEIAKLLSDSETDVRRQIRAIFAITAVGEKQAVLNHPLYGKLVK